MEPSLRSWMTVSTSAQNGIFRVHSHARGRAPSQTYRHRQPAPLWGPGTLGVAQPGPHCPHPQCPSPTAPCRLWALWVLVTGFPILQSGRPHSSALCPPPRNTEPTCPGVCPAPCVRTVGRVVLGLQTRGLAAKEQLPPVPNLLGSPPKPWSALNTQPRFPPPHPSLQVSAPSPLPSGASMSPPTHHPPLFAILCFHEAVLPSGVGTHPSLEGQLLLLGRVPKMPSAGTAPGPEWTLWTRGRDSSCLCSPLWPHLPGPRGQCQSLL